MKRKLRETAGSGVIWAMIVAGFLLIIIGAVLSMSLSYYQRSLRNGEARQAYLTARSAVDAMVQEFTGGSAASEEIYRYLQENGRWTVDPVEFPQEMGDCSLELELTPATEETPEASIAVSATGRVGKKQQTVTAVLVGVIQREGEPPPEGPGDPEVPEDPDAPTEPEEPPLTWYLSAYQDGGRGEGMEG